MNKTLITTLIVGGLITSNGVIAGDREVLKNNPYNVDQPYEPNVVIGVERTREETLASENKPKVGIKKPVELNKIAKEKTLKEDSTTTLSTDIIVAEMTQPTVNAAQNKLAGTPQEFLMVTKPNSRIYISKTDGKVYFLAQAGSLKDNLTTLLAATNTHLPLVYQVSDQHSNPTDVWLYGDSALDILNAIIGNYKNPHPIRANTYGNRVVEIYYDRKNRTR